MAASAANATAEAAKTQAANSDASSKQAKNDLMVLQSKYSESEPLIATAKEQKKAAEDARIEVTHRHTELTTRHATLQTDANLILERATRAEKDAAAAKSEVEAVRQSAKNSDARLSDATTNLACLNVDVGKLQSLLAKATAHREEAEEAKIDLEQRLITALQKYDVLQSDFNAATGRDSAAQADVEHKRIQIDGMSRTIETLEKNLTDEKAKLNQALAKQQSSEDAIRQFENISQAILKDVLDEAKRGVSELAATLQKTGGEELSRHAEKVALTLEPLQAQLHAYDEAVKSFQVGSLESHVSLKEQLSRLQENRA